MKCILGTPNLVWNTDPAASTLVRQQPAHAAPAGGASAAVAGRAEPRTASEAVTELAAARLKEKYEGRGGTGISPVGASVPARSTYAKHAVAGDASSASGGGARRAADAADAAHSRASGGAGAGRGRTSAQPSWWG